MLIIECIDKNEFEANRVKVQCDWLAKLPPHLAKPLIHTIRDRAFDFRGVCEGRGGGGGTGVLFFFS